MRADEVDPITGASKNIVEVVQDDLYQSGRPVSVDDVMDLGINSIVSLSRYEQPWISNWVKDGYGVFGGPEQPRHYVRAQVPLWDSAGCLDVVAADAAVDFVVRLLSDDWRTVLVHCDMGAFRSVHVCACVLSKITIMDPTEAFRHVDRSRGDPSPRDSLSMPDWRDHLLSYE